MKFISNIRFNIDVLTSRLAKNTGLLFLGGGIATILNTVQAILVARILGSSEYGYFALVVASVGIVLQFTDFRTWEVVIGLLPRSLREGSEDHSWEIVYTMFFVDLISGCITILIVSILGGFLAEVFANDESLGSLIRLYSLIAPAMLLSNGVFAGFLRTFDKFSWITAKSVVVNFLQFGLIMLALAMDLGIRGVLIGIIISQYIDMFASLLLVRREWKAQIDHPSNISGLAIIRTLKRHGNYIGNIWLSGSIKGLQSRIDVLLLGLFASPSAVGKYRLSLDVVGSLSRIGSPFQDSLFPMISELESANERGSIWRIGKQVTVFLGIILVPVLVIVIFFGEPIMLLMVGDDYEGTGVILAILTVGIVVNTILVWARPLLIAQLRIKQANIIAIAGFLLEIFLFLLLVPKLQAIGVALALSGMYILNAVVSAWVGLRGILIEESAPH